MHRCIMQNKFWKSSVHSVPDHKGRQSGTSYAYCKLPNLHTKTTLTCHQQHECHAAGETNGVNELRWVSIRPRTNRGRPRSPISAAIHEANFTHRILGHDHEPRSSCARVYKAQSGQKRPIGLCEATATRETYAGSAATALQSSAVQRGSQVEVGCTLLMPLSQHQQQPSVQTSSVQQSTPAQAHKQCRTQQSAQHDLVQQSTSAQFHEQRRMQQSAQQNLMQHQPASAQPDSQQHQHTWAQPEAEVSKLPFVQQPSQMQSMLQCPLSCSGLADNRACDLELVEQSGLGTIDASSALNTQQVCMPLITSKLCICSADSGFALNAQQVCLPPLCLSWHVLPVCKYTSTPSFRWNLVKYTNRHIDRPP